MQNSRNSIQAEPWRILYLGLGNDETLEHGDKNWLEPSCNLSSRRSQGGKIHEINSWRRIRLVKISGIQNRETTGDQCNFYNDDEPN
jgi:hypothetical protein